MEEVLIITGGSKGIGSGIIESYLKSNVRVFSLARTVKAELSIKGVTQIEIDLTQIPLIENELKRVFEAIDPSKVSKISLINNAGTLGKIGPLEKLDLVTITNAINLNTAAPFLLSAIFVKATQGWAAKKSIINITSGAALKPYFGWAAYCSTKAALNMLTQTLALEQAEINNGVKVIAIAPGVVDTDMQVEIRESDKADFKAVERFIALKKDGGLNEINVVGAKIFEIDHDETIESGAVLRLEGK